MSEEIQTIYKYSFPIQDEITIPMPQGARILCVQTQNGVPCIWVLVSPDGPQVARRFHIRGTGHDATGIDGALYIGTFQLHNGALVFHMFEDR